MPNKNDRTAVITGIGIVSPIGIGVHRFWKNLLAGRSGMGRITHFDASGFPCQFAGEVRDFQPERHLNKRQIKYFSRASQFAAVAAAQALADASLSAVQPQADVLIGSGISAYDFVEAQIRDMLAAPAEFAPGVTDPFVMQKSFLFAPAAAVALRAGATGYVSTISSACASGINAVGVAAQRIREGYADLVIAGGVDTPVSRVMLQAFCAARFVSCENDEPQKALRPFDRQRTRTALGEGAALFILESAKRATLRGARIYGAIAGFAHNTENTNEIFSLDTSGRNWAYTIRNTLKGARVDHINAHAPSDIHIDAAEARALQSALGSRRLGETPVTSIKAAIGSGLAAAGALQIATAALSLRTGRIPPTVNYASPDPDCALNVSARSRKRKLCRILVNTHAVGGINAALLLEAHTTQRAGTVALPDRGINGGHAL